MSATFLPVSPTESALSATLFANLRKPSLPLAASFTIWSPGGVDSVALSLEETEPGAIWLA
ncbi:hypothetical protein C6W10_07820 [Plantactinospora sp. BB1]|nr:hypothetical protein C6W10_07820 [Plantactinospora sp. BB1]